jgi:hypothetical protein
MKELLYKFKKWFYRNSPINVHHEMTRKLEELHKYKKVLPIIAELARPTKTGDDSLSGNNYIPIVTPEEWYDFGDRTSFYHVTNPSFVDQELLESTQVAHRFSLLLQKLSDTNTPFSFHVTEAGMEYGYSRTKFLVHKLGEPSKDVLYAMYNAMEEVTKHLDQNATKEEAQSSVQE